PTDRAGRRAARAAMPARLSATTTSPPWARSVPSRGAVRCRDPVMRAVAMRSTLTRPGTPQGAGTLKLRRGSRIVIGAKHRGNDGDEEEDEPCPHVRRTLAGKAA